MNKKYSEEFIKIVLGQCACFCQMKFRPHIPNKKPTTLDKGKVGFSIELRTWYPLYFMTSKQTLPMILYLWSSIGQKIFGGIKMNKEYREETINAVVDRYGKGQSVASLSSEHGIPRSTIYYWLKKHKKLKSVAGIEISHRDYYDLQRRAGKLEERLEVIKAADCSLSSPLKEKLEALEKLHGQFSIHALCDALGVSRGTFYNHIFRRKDVTSYDKRREEMKKHIKIAFEESRQRFGSSKIWATLADRGIRTTPKYVAELMQEMGLSSVRKGSKRQHKKERGFAEKQEHSATAI
jgi:transposase-like protein